MGNSVHGAPPPANAHRHAWRTLPGGFCGEPRVQNQATACEEAGRGAGFARVIWQTRTSYHYARRIVGGAFKGVRELLGASVS